MIILFLLTLHYIADYPLQGDFLGTMKGKYDYLLFVHCFIWAGVVGFGLYLIGTLVLWKYLFLFIGHFVIDRWKCRQEDKTHALTKHLWIDQGLHAVQILVVGLL